MRNRAEPWGPFRCQAYLYRLAHFAFRRRRIVLAIWLARRGRRDRHRAGQRRQDQRQLHHPGHRGAERRQRPHGQAAGASAAARPRSSSPPRGTEQGHRPGRQGRDRVALPAQVASSAGLHGRRSVPRQAGVARADKVALGQVQWSARADRCEGRQPQRDEGRDEAGAGRRRTGRVQRQRLSGLAHCRSPSCPNWSA